MQDMWHRMEPGSGIALDRAVDLLVKVLGVHGILALSCAMFLNQASWPSIITCVHDFTGSIMRCQNQCKFKASLTIQVNVLSMIMNYYTQLI